MGIGAPGTPFVLERVGSDGIVRVMQARIVALILSISLASMVLSQTAVPRFAGYPAIGSYYGKNATVVLGKEEREFHTRLRSAAGQAPNFAGHFIVTAWGCGTECLAGAIIDANLGTVYWLPHTICCWGDVGEKFRPIKYRLDSRLIVFSGERNEKEGDGGAHFYDFKDGKFVHIQTILNGGGK